jgi:NhaP-type Na+/H+ or K+/H+ antiporter
MTVWQTIALLITLTALFCFSNHRFIRLPTTIGGPCGGISVALALSLPTGSQRDLLLTMTYIVVIFSILVQAFRPELQRGTETIATSGGSTIATSICCQHLVERGQA